MPSARAVRRAMRYCTRVRESGSPELCIACLLVPTTLSWEEELHTETETAARMFELLDVWCRGDCTLFPKNTLNKCQKFINEIQQQRLGMKPRTQYLPLLWPVQ